MTPTEIITPEPAAVRRCYLHPETGTRLPGVTDVLSLLGGKRVDGLMGWANHLGRSGKSHITERDRKASIGTEAHRLRELHLRGQPTKEIGLFANPIEEAGFRAYRRWAAWWPTSGYSAQHVELALVDGDLGYGGTMDGVYVKDTHGVVADLKTGSRAHDEVIIQLGAYAGLCWKHGLPVTRGLVEHFPPEGDTHLIEVSSEQLQSGYAAFVALLFIHQRLSNLRLAKGV